MFDVVPFSLSAFLTYGLLVLLVILACMVWASRHLVHSVIYLGQFSLCITLLYLTMDAPDVALTEAAIGACLSTLLMFFVLRLVGEHTSAWRISGAGATIFLLLIGGFVLLGLSTPPYGSADTPPHTHVALHYLQKSGEEIGIPSVVASVLASYRGFDTLGETYVILIAGLCVYALLAGSLTTPTPSPRVTSSLIRNSLWFLLPFIWIFGFYIQIHGEISPGGGFQAGAIMASGLIAYHLVSSPDPKMSGISLRLLQYIALIGGLMYTGVGIACLARGGHFLEYSVLLPQHKTAQALGIFTIELGVGCTVTATLSLLLLLFDLQPKKRSI